MKIYPLHARIPVKIGDAVFKLSPFSHSQKLELAQYSQFQAGEYVQNAAKMTFKAMKYSIKGVEGIIDGLTGEAYQPTFDEDGTLSDASVNDLLNIEVSNSLVMACIQFVKGVPTSILDQNGEPMSGVEIMPADSAIKKN